MTGWVEKIGIVAGVTMPLFNIPLILRIVQRKSSADISLSWAMGVWICILLMTPQALRSHDAAFRSFGVVNLFFFTAVTFCVLKYRTRNKT